jgi:hypothetical protein
MTVQTDSYNYQGEGYTPPDPRYIQFNPPISRINSGAYTLTRDRRNEAGNTSVNQGFSRDNTTGRNVILGPDSFPYRNLLKGVLYQDANTSHTTDGTSAWDAPPDSPYEGFKVLGNARYGFRFHYNPSLIDFSVNADVTTIDPGLILSGATRAMPIAPASLPTINFSLVINRIEDISALSEGSYARNDMKYYYGRELTQEEIDGIIRRGTGYDMEFLFRAMLGRPYQTELRGETADIGIVFGLPLILDFSPRHNIKQGVARTVTNGVGTPTTLPLDELRFNDQHGQRYWGRVIGISYTHREFNRNMVPMFTEVSVSFARFPDAKGERRDAQDTSNPNSAARRAEAARLSGQASTGYSQPAIPPTDFYLVGVDAVTGKNIYWDLDRQGFFAASEYDLSVTHGNNLTIVDAPESIKQNWEDQSGDVLE